MNLFFADNLDAFKDLHTALKGLIITKIGLTLDVRHSQLDIDVCTDLFTQLLALLFSPARLHTFLMIDAIMATLSNFKIANLSFAHGKESIAQKVVVATVTHEELLDHLALLI